MSIEVYMCSKASSRYVQCKCMTCISPHPGSDHNVTSRIERIVPRSLNCYKVFPVSSMCRYEIQGYIPSREGKLCTNLSVTFVDVHTVPIQCSKQCFQKTHGTLLCFQKPHCPFLKFLTVCPNTH